MHFLGKSLAGEFHVRREVFKSDALDGVRAGGGVDEGQEARRCAKAANSADCDVFVADAEGGEVCRRLPVLVAEVAAVA